MKGLSNTKSIPSYCYLHKVENNYKSTEAFFRALVLSLRFCEEDTYVYTPPHLTCDDVCLMVQKGERMGGREEGVERSIYND